mmetsp:Transcript_81196/g.238586  ORF Transcript_81196/g.238586 Transcript_81196/m.238586 type:complete len:271 (-) Transcript_81196:2182-2994(-)
MNSRPCLDRVASVHLQACQEGLGLLLIAPLRGHHDLLHGCVDVLWHLPGTAANVEMPSPAEHQLSDVSARLLDPVLHVDLPGLVPGEGRVHGQDTLLDILLQLLPVEVLLLGVARAEEEDALSDLKPLPALHDSQLRDGSPGSEPGAHAGHDDGVPGVVGQHDCALADSTHEHISWPLLSHVAGGLAQPPFTRALHGPVNHHDAELNHVRVHGWRAGNGIAAGLQRRDHVDDLIKRRPGTLETFQDIGMVRIVVDEITVQGLSTLRLLND